MTFLLSTTFTDSFARLGGEEQKAVKTTVFDLQINPQNPGLQFHKLDKARDKNFWSVRVNKDLRIIVHKTEASLLVCYVDHHDKAYAWGERRKLETHPKTGAAQLVEIRETVKEIELPVYRAVEKSAGPKPALFAQKSDDELLAYGVPQEWLADVRKADEDGILALAERLPAEAGEALLELATGGSPRMAAVEKDAEPLQHPDAQRRFRVVENVEELERALEFPWDRWSIFLHPEQRQWVQGEYKGPAKVAGSAGTGKTIVALHRAVHLARKHEDTRVLLATFSGALARSLSIKLRRLVNHEPRLAERVDVHSLDSLGQRLYTARFGQVKLVERPALRGLMAQASKEVKDHSFGLPFLMAEWDHVVDAWQLQSWEQYRDVARLGRKLRLPEARRQTAWQIFEKVRAGLQEQGLTTLSGVFTALAEHLKEGGSQPFDFAVVDEAQDLSVAQLRFFAALGTQRPDALFFAGDLGQRIFQQPFSWKALGVDIRGRSRTLRVNYRTSHQIRRQADRLLGPVVRDVDGNEETRNDTISVLNGPPPDILLADNAADEATRVGQWLAAQVHDGVAPEEIGVFVRSEAQLDRAREALKKAKLSFKLLDEKLDLPTTEASLSTMHLAKGLEFRAVAVMACDEEVLPLQERIEAVGDEGDLEEVYDTERQLLYVACTRARDFLLVSAVKPGSEFLEDMGGV